MSADYPSTPERVLAERHYQSVDRPSYQLISDSAKPARAEHAEQDNPGAIPYCRPKQCAGVSSS